jgi:hypothetical protein
LTWEARKPSAVSSVGTRPREGEVEVEVEEEVEVEVEVEEEVEVEVEVSVEVEVEVGLKSMTPKPGDVVDVGAHGAEEMYPDVRGAIHAEEADEEPSRRAVAVEQRDGDGDRAGAEDEHGGGEAYDPVPVEDSH